MTTTSTTASDGTVTTSTEFDPNLIPAGCAILGPYDTGNPMPTMYQDAYVNPQAYLYQNGAFVSNPNYATVQLAEAKTAKIASLQQSFAQVFLNGFLSSATGTQGTFGCAPADMTNMGDELNSVNAGIAVYPIAWLAFDGVTTVSFTTAAEFKQLAQDAYNFKWTQINNLRTKIAAVQAATTVDAVIAVTW